MKKVLFSFSVGMLILSLVACAAPPMPTPPVARAEIIQSDKPRLTDLNVPPQDLSELVVGNTAFALDLYRQLSSENSENLFFSPYSLSTALAMTYAGARGDTEKQMASALQFTLPQERLHPAFNALDQYFTQLAEALQDDKGNPAFRLHIANALWGQQGYEFLSEFLDTLAQNYGAGLQLLDFSSEPEEARQTINQWISDQTEQRIKDLIPQDAIDPLTRLVLTNAIYFNAAWQYPFEKEATTEAPFTLLNGEKITVPMMQLSKSLLYAEGEGYQLVSLPYAGGSLEMIVILPAPGAFESVEAKLTPDWLAQALASRQSRTVNLSFPKFKIESDFSLVDALSNLGMPIAFQPDKADFSGMDGKRDLFIGEVVHKAFVNVDEAGTEAAAATAVIMELTSAFPDEPISMIVDRPFIFGIRDVQHGNLLFLGRVTHP